MRSAHFAQLMVNSFNCYSAHLQKNAKLNFNLITIGCFVIATGWKLKKDLELGPSLQNQTKKELEMFVVSYVIISSNFNLI